MFLAYDKMVKSLHEHQVLFAHPILAELTSLSLRAILPRCQFLTGVQNNIEPAEAEWKCHVDLFQKSLHASFTPTVQGNN
jgi:hypothetical protein